MFARWSYWMWTQGKIDSTVTMALDAGRRYLITGSIVGKSGGDYGQIYISTLCTFEGGSVKCGIRDDPSDPPEWKIKNLNAVEFVQNATRVTMKLSATGGFHRAQGTIYDIT